VIRVRGRDLWQAFQAWRGRGMQERLSSVSVETIEQIRTAERASFRSKVRETVRMAEACCYRPDMAMPWIGPAVEAAVKVCKRKRPNVIWATAGPVSSCIVAQRASRCTGVPYVLDFRDPYGLDYYESELRCPAWVRHLYRRTLYQLFEGAQALVFQFD